MLYRVEGGIAPLVELLNFPDVKVQRAAAGALRTVSFRNDENKSQVCFYYDYVLFRLMKGMILT
jgi:hypothetical protein